MLQAMLSQTTENHSYSFRMLTIRDIGIIVFGKEDMSDVFSRYRRRFKNEGMTSKRIISLVDKRTKMIRKDHMPDSPYGSKLMSKNFQYCNKG